MHWRLNLSWGQSGRFPPCEILNQAAGDVVPPVATGGRTISVLFSEWNLRNYDSPRTLTILTLKTSAYSLTMSPFNKEDNLSSHLRSLGQCVATPADASERDGLKPTGKNEKSMWQPCLLAH